MVISPIHRHHANRIAAYLADRFRDYDDPGFDDAANTLSDFYAYTHGLSDLDRSALHYWTYLRVSELWTEVG